MKSVLLLASTLLLSPLSFAFFRIDPPKLPEIRIEAPALPELPTASDIEKGVKQLGDAAADVITLGENGRRRDQERAEHAAELAAEEKRQAEAIKAEKIKTQEIKITMQRQKIESLKSFHQDSEILNSMIETSLRFTVLFAKSISNQSLEFQVFRETVESQQNDLLKWIRHLESRHQSPGNESENSVSMQQNLKSKVESYVDQLNRFPRNQSDLQNETVLEDATTSGSQLLRTVKMNLETLTTEIQMLESELRNFESELSNLNNTSN